MIIKKIEARETWGLRQQAMWPDRELEYVKLPEDAAGTHYGLFAGGQLVSVISLFFAGEEIQFRKFATHSEKQRLGFGTKLLRFILEDTEVAAAKRIWCHARVSASEFYRRLGFAAEGEAFERDGVAYIKMSKALNGESHRA